MAENFRGNDLQGKGISDLVNKYEYYGFQSAEDSLTYINKTITKLESILFKVVPIIGNHEYVALRYLSKLLVEVTEENYKSHFCYAPY